MSSDTIKDKGGGLPATAEVYDNALSWKVKSRRNPREVYVVDLGDYNCNGRCFCKDFQIHFEPLLKRGYTAEKAVAEGLVAVREYQVFARNALSCFHICDARDQLAHYAAKAFQTAAKAHAPQA